MRHPGRCFVVPCLLCCSACLRIQQDPPPPEPQGRYVEQASLAAGSEPASLVLADLDGDGELDLAVANYVSNDVSVFRGAGDGSFAAHDTLATAAGPRTLTGGDYDDDGDVDLAVTNRDAGSLTLFWNDGAAGFQSETLAAAAEPVFITTADLDEDGIADLVTTDGEADVVSVYLAQGGGTFAPRADFATGAQPLYAAFADFNEDGDRDLAVAEYATPPEVSLLLGDGLGGFATAQSYRASNRPGVIFPIAPRVVDAADVDGDGHDDVMVGNRGLDVLDGEVWSLPGDGSGELGEPEEVPGATVLAPGYIKLIDLDDDGNLDFVEADHDPALAALVGAFGGSGYSVCITRGDGAGTFEGTDCLPTGAYPYDVAFGDLNHDAKLDLVIAVAGADVVAVFLANW